MSFDWIGQQDAASKNQAASKQTNTANLILNMLSRGQALTPAMAHRLGLSKDMATGTGAAILPYYMGGAEQDLGLSAADLSKYLSNIGGSPEEQTSAIQKILAQSGEGFDANTMLSNDIATGRTSQQMLDENAPVASARMDVATGKKNAALEALSKTLGDIDRIQAKKGFYGDSMGNRLLKTGARVNIATSGANDLGQAKLQNAQEKAGIQQQGRQMRIANIGLPDTLTAAAANRTTLPGRTVAAGFNTSLTPLSFFNLGPHGFTPQQNAPLVSAASSPWTGASAAGSAGANAATNYFSNKKLQNQYNNTDPSFGSYGSSAGYGDQSGMGEGDIWSGDGGGYVSGEG